MMRRVSSADFILVVFFRRCPVNRHLSVHCTLAIDSSIRSFFQLLLYPALLAFVCALSIWAH